MVVYSLKQFIGLAGTVANLCREKHFSEDELNRLHVILEPPKPSGEVVLHIGGPAPFKINS